MINTNINISFYNNIKYIINIGDGINEYIATLLLNNHFNINVKHIKMLKKPSFYQLIYELILLNKNINYFINNDNNKEFLFYLYNIKNNTASF